ncbi:MAG TPA: hypothetical protein VF797_04605 [Noviherbaspirillum sp.]
MMRWLLRQTRFLRHGGPVGKNRRKARCVGVAADRDTAFMRRRRYRQVGRIDFDLHLAAVVDDP